MNQARNLSLSTVVLMTVGVVDSLATVRDTLELAPPGAVRMGGWTGVAISTCRVARILGQNVEELLQPFRERAMTNWWRCEFWGKWFTSAAWSYRDEPLPALRDLLQRAAHGLIAAQSPDGCISSYRPDAELLCWDVWGRKYSLLGLLAYHDIVGDKRSLDSARRLADYTMGQFGPGRANIATTGWWSGMAASSILEPITLLYRRTGEERYLRFAEYIVRAWEELQGPDLVRKALNGVPVFRMFPGPDPSKKGYASGGESKAYEMMSCYEGVLELYRATGDPRYAEAVRRVFDNILDTEITILGSGSSWERWCDGKRRQGEPVPEWMETCVTVTWIKLAAQLLRWTGESRYFDEIERAHLNALLGAQKFDGTWWCHYSPLEGARAAAPDQCRMRMNCCVANGPRALNLHPALAVMSAAEGPVVNSLEPLTADLPIRGEGRVRLAIHSKYPEPGPVKLYVSARPSLEFTLALRIPGWSRSASASINGTPLSPPRSGEYLRIRRVWHENDLVELDLDFCGRAESEPGGSGRLAVRRGPIVFALDRRISCSIADHSTGSFDVGPDATFELRSVPAAELPPTIRSAVDVPLKTTAGSRIWIRMCDYASAGATWDEASTLRVWCPYTLDLSDPFSGIPKSRH